MRDFCKVLFVLAALMIPALAQTPGLNGTWIGNYTDSALAGYESLDLTIRDGGTVTGFFKTDSGKDGDVSGTAVGEIVSLRVEQATESCPGSFTFDLVLRDNTLAGQYSGGDCDGQHRMGHVVLSRSDKYLKPTVMRAPDGAFLPIDPIYVQGVAHWSLQTDRFFIGASTKGVEGYTGLWLFIVNRTEQPVTFDPDEVKVFDMVSKRFLKRYSPSDIDRKIYRSARFQASLAAFAAGMSSSGTTTSNTRGDVEATDQYGNRYSGSVNGRTTTYHSSDGRESAVAAERVRQDAASRAAQFDSNALLKHTILPGQSVMGFVFFSRSAKGNLKDAAQLDEKGELISAEVKVGTETFRLMFPVDTSLRPLRRVANGDELQPSDGIDLVSHHQRGCPALNTQSPSPSDIAAHKAEQTREA